MSIVYEGLHETAGEFVNRIAFACCMQQGGRQGGRKGGRPG